MLSHLGLFWGLCRPLFWIWAFQCGWIFVHATRRCLPDLGLMLGHCGLFRHHIGLMLSHFGGFCGLCWPLLGKSWDHIGLIFTHFSVVEFSSMQHVRKTYLKWASMVLAGTGKEGKTKEVVKDREGKTVGMYVCMCVCMYVCTYVRTYVCMCVVVCVWQSCVWKMLRVKDDVCARQCRPFFSPALQCQLLCMRQYCGPGIGWMMCSMIFCAPCGATRCATWQPRLPRKTTMDVRLCHACHVKRW